MSVRIDDPRRDSNTYYLAALDRYGNYSNPLEFTIQHPGIQKLVLEEQDVQELISSLKITLPKAYTERSQEVYPETVANEEKEILGYRLYVQEIDYDTGNPIGDEEIIDYDVQEINEKGVLYYQSQTGKKFEIRVGCYDSVYHPIHNPTLFESTISDIVTATTFKVERPDISEALINPNDLTTSLQGTGLTQDDFGDRGIESTYTIQAGVWDDTASEPIVGGIGLAYNSEENDIDVQIVADRFRLFDPDVEPDGKALFATGTIDGASQIYMNANNIAMVAENSELSTSNFFELSGEGLSIDTPGFQLDKAGNAVFNGEVISEIFSLSSGDITISDSGISSTDFNLNASTGDASFSGELSAATGRLGDTTNYVYFDGTNLDIKTAGLDISGGNAEFSGDLNGASGTFSGDITSEGVINYNNLAVEYASVYDSFIYGGSGGASTIVTPNNKNEWNRIRWEGNIPSGAWSSGSNHDYAFIRINHQSMNTLSGAVLVWATSDMSRTSPVSPWRVSDLEQGEPFSLGGSGEGSVLVELTTDPGFTLGGYLGPIVEDDSVWLVVWKESGEALDSLNLFVKRHSIN